MLRRATRLSVILSIAVFAVFIAAACSAPSAATQPNAPAATSGAAPAVPTAPAPPTEAVVKVAPTAALPAATAPVTPTKAAAATTGTSATDAVEASTGGAVRLKTVRDGTKALYRVREQLAGRDLPSDAVGTTQNVTGTLVIEPDATLPPGQSKFVVDLSTLQSDQGRRDNFIKGNTLNTAQYPTAEFVPTAVNGLASPLPSSGEVKFQIVGDMTVHGTTRPVTWDVTATINGQELTGSATTALKFADFGLSRPRVPLVLSVEDNIRLEIDFQMVVE